MNPSPSVKPTFDLFKQILKKDKKLCQHLVNENVLTPGLPG